MTTPPPTRAFGAPFTPLAIDESALAHEFAPSAFGGFYDEGDRPRPYTLRDGVAVVSIDGPLDTRADWWSDGYDAIAARVAMAFADPKALAVLLAIDSPGGACAGNLDCAEQLRAMAEASGKPLVAHAGTMACSAAYALATAADTIVASRDALLGSIGVIATVYDRTAANEQRGLNVKVVRSGPLKADPHPDVALTDASVARVRQRVNALADAFAAHVAARRPQVGDPLALQGASLTAADAVTRGLADAPGTLADAISTAASMAAARTKEKTMDANATKSLETLAALRGQLAATTDEEVIASVATLAKRAAQVEPMSAELATLRQQLADRDAATVASARQAVLDKHLQRGALTPAMQADAAYMGDLAPLKPDALDRVLSKLPGLAAPVAPRAAGTDPTGAVDPAAVELTAEDRAMARAAGLTDEVFLATKRRDAERFAR